MRLAGHTLGTPEQTVPEALALFAAAGLDAAEVIYQDDYRSGLPLRERRPAEEARRASEDLGIPIVGLTPYTTGINAVDDGQWRSAVDEFRGAIEIAQIVGADRLRVYAGAWHPGDQDHAAHWDRLLEALRTLAPEASAAGVRLCVENHFGTMTQSAAETARLVREVDHDAVRVLYDQANLTFAHDEPYEEALRIQGDLVGHVHVKDLVFTDPDAPFQASETARVARPSARCARASSATASCPGPASSRPWLPSATTTSSPLNTSTVGTQRICPIRQLVSRGPHGRSAAFSPTRGRGGCAVSAPAKTRVGVIGAGNIATIAQLPTLVKRDDVELAALVSRRPDPGPLMRRWGFGSGYSTVEDMLAAEHLDAVFVLTPRSEHAHAVEACLRRDVDVFCEKPLAPSVEEAERLADLADERGRILMVDFNRRYAPVYVAGREPFGAAGATFCVAQKNRPGSEYRATFENAIHMVDLLRWYCGGEAVEVTAHAAGNDPWEEDGTAAMIRFDSGGTGVLMAARTAGAWSEKLDAYGSGRSAEVRAPESVSITVDGVTTSRELSAEAFGWATATETLGFAAAVHHFLDRIVDRQPPLTSGRDAVATQRLLDRILEAAGLPTREQEGRQWASHATNAALP